MPDTRLLYHGSREIVELPEVRVTWYHKDFYFGFYCTSLKEQAERWAVRYGQSGIVNEYIYMPSCALRVLTFPEMSEEWLDFIVACRSGTPHDYDVVEGPMANDTIFNYIQSFIDGEITRTALWELAKFKRPTNQISFHTARAIASLEFLKGYVVSYGV